MPQVYGQGRGSRDVRRRWQVEGLDALLNVYGRLKVWGSGCGGLLMACTGRKRGCYGCRQVEGLDALLNVYGRLKVCVGVRLSVGSFDPDPESSHHHQPSHPQDTVQDN